MIDMHIHSNFSPDSKSPISQIASVAKLKGLKMIGITDHYEMREGRVLHSFDIEKFMEESQKHSEEVEIIKGVEWGWDCFGEEPDFSDLDFVMLSIHLCEKPAELAYECYKDYLTRVLNCAEKAYDFQVLGHLDFVRRYIPGNPDVPDDLRKIVIEILEVLKERGAALELNTEGFAVYGEPQPAFWVFKEANKLGIPATVGSDAHNLENIGRYIDKAYDILKSAGYKNVVIFRKKCIEEMGI